MSAFSKKGAKLQKIVEKSGKNVQKITFLMKNCCFCISISKNVVSLQGK